MNQLTFKISNSYNKSIYILATNCPKTWAIGYIKSLKTNKIEQKIIVIGKANRSLPWWEDYKKFIRNQNKFGDFNHGSNVYQIVNEDPLWKPSHTFQEEKNEND